jgi:GntR family transcriptional regulator
MFPLDPNDPRPLYVQIMDGVRRGILRRSLRPDDALPSVRDLARDLRVNPNTVQQAYRELEREGLVYVRRGQGTFVSPDLDPAPVREAVIRQLADRFTREAAQIGLTLEEVVEGIRGVRESRTPPDSQEGDDR